MDDTTVNKPRGERQNLTRRKLLAGCTTIGISLAGCSVSSSNDNRTNNQTGDETNNTPDSGTPLKLFESSLTGHGILVESVSYNQNQTRVLLEYVSRDSQSTDTVTNEIGTISGLFYNRISADLDVERLDATIFDKNGNAQIEWYAEREWYNQLQEGKLTPEELSIRVVETAQPVQ